MSESLWEPDEVPQVKKHRPRQAQPMRSVTPTPQPEPVRRASFTRREPPRDYAMEDALRAVAPILHPDELPGIAHILDPTRGDAALKRRIRDWRERNGFLE